jgi:hypothetical protein
MTAMTLTAATAHREPVSSSVAAFIAEFCAGVRDGRDIEARYNVLARMSADDLGRLGLTRADIARVAVTAKFR